jgi:RNA polymerase sigma-70 factor (ECF subfamily)
MTSELDPGCLKRARAGDTHAFRVLYDHHADAVFRFVARMLRDETSAEDALQEVFVRVFAALPRFDPAGPARLSTWIFTIARRVALTAIDRQRTRENHRRALPRPVEAVTAQHDLRLVLEAAVADLPDVLRSTFVLRECCDLSYDEVATIEGLDIGTVKSRLHRARALLQASLLSDPAHESAPDPAAARNVVLVPERHRHEVRAATKG